MRVLRLSGTPVDKHGLLTYDNRIVIPTDMREEILERIHTGHQGITRCPARANLSVW